MQKKSSTLKLSKAKKREKFEEELVAEVEQDFKKRREERLLLERQWELNMNYLGGNQYCGIDGRGELYDDGVTYFWQNREVYNHIAPLIESRVAKFSRIAPTVSVRPLSDDDSDVTGASSGEKLLEETFKKQDVYQTVNKVTNWSETCGTGFYKIVWDNYGGNKLGELNGKDVYEGEARVLPVSPFEIFPDSIYNENLNDCLSLIHAKAVPASEVKEKYGVEVKGKSVGVFNLDRQGFSKANQNVCMGQMDDAVIVIERYERPSSEYPNGRLVTVAEGKLLYYGELPYLNGVNKARTYPFVKQDSIAVAGRFFGMSIIERLIPVQRAFNAVKNRKHEFLNRLSMGIMKVEDGSIDVDDLAEEGLSPGKVLVYRQGYKSPEMLEDITMPADFNEEENKLLNEFVIISGVSDVASSRSTATVQSGTALEILVEQDNERLISTAEAIRKSYLEIARQIIRLFSQFLSGIKALTYRDSYSKVKTLYIDCSSVNSDDVYLENENELLYTERQKKEVLMGIYNSGLLTDENGKIRQSTKEKVLSLLGYKDLDYRKGISRLHEEKAQSENVDLEKTERSVEEIDDDDIHVEVHTRYMLSEYSKLSEEQKQRFFIHLKAHKERINQKI